MDKNGETIKVRIVEIEGSLSELEKVPLIAEVLRLGGDRTSPSRSESLPTLAKSLIERESPPASRDLLLEFAEEICAWEGVTGATSRSNREGKQGSYVRFSRRPQYVGAFAYLVPSRLTVRLRLPSGTQEKAKYATARGVRAQDPYQLSIPLRRESLEEAITLTRQAYEAAAVPSDRSSGGQR
jgi:hypothetical protein